MKQKTQDSTTNIINKLGNGEIQSNQTLNQNEKPKKDTVVLITGASNGIGLATANRFAKEGYRVVATLS